MSKVIYSLSVSLDGYVETAAGGIEFTNPDDELHAFVNDQLRALGAFVHGRRTYELMASYWPTADQDPAASPVTLDFARIWLDTPKVVFSKTLETVQWNSRLLRDGLVEEVSRLTQLPDYDLDVGGPTLAATLIQRDLIDEYRMFLCPIVLGGGKPYFPALERPLQLQLVETRTFGNKVVFLRYQRSPIGSKP